MPTITLLWLLGSKVESKVEIIVLVVALAFHFHLSVAIQYLTRQHKTAVSFSKTKQSQVGLCLIKT